MKKLFVSLLCVVMIVTFMPSMAFAAETPNSTADNTVDSVNADAPPLSPAEVLQEKINAGGTVVLEESIDVSNAELVIPEGASVTLDLNGKTLTAANTKEGRILVRGALTLVDSSVEEMGKIKSTTKYGGSATGYAVLDVLGTGSFTMNGGRIETAVGENPADDGNFGIGVNDNATITINDGFVTAGWYAISGNGSNKSQNTVININGGELSSIGDTGIYLPQNGITNIAGGKIVGKSGIAIKAGSLNITGGEIIANGEYKSPSVPSNNGNNPNGSAIQIETNDSYAPVKHIEIGGTAVVKSEKGAAVTQYQKENNQNSFGDSGETVVITGGTITGADDESAFEVSNEAKDDITVTGGKFSSNIEDFVPSGMEVTEDGGSFTIVERPNAAAKIGTAVYAALGDALEAAKSKTVEITILKNLTEDIVIEKGQNITLDLNGKKVTNLSNHTIVNKGTLTVKGTGVIDNITHAKAALYNEVGAIADLKGGDFTRSKENGQSDTSSGGNSFYNILNHGTMNVYDGVKVVQNGQFSSLLENGWSNGNQNTEKKTSTLTIYGGVFSGGLNTIKNDDYGVLIIKDGTFSNTSQATVLNWNQATIEGGTFTSEKNVILNGYLDTTMDQGKLTITGGTFTSKKNTVDRMGGSTHIGNIEIKGGTFTSEEETTLPAKTQLGVDGSLTVTKGTFSDLSALEYLGSNLEKGNVRVTLPEGKNVEIPENADANVIFIAKAGTTVKNNTNMTVTISTPSGDYQLEPGKEITSQNPYIPPTTPVQKPTIVVEQS